MSHHHWHGGLPPSRLRAHFVKAKVRVHEYPDGTLAVYWGPHRLADYDASGGRVEPVLSVGAPALDRAG